VRFCPWYPLPDADGHAPASAGVFQVRIADGLVDYPTGKSAMIHYEAAGDVRAAVASFRGVAGGRAAAWLCRHTIEMTATEATGEAAVVFCQRLVREFTTRFGVPPRIPA
jgi:hypothetical protein